MDIDVLKSLLAVAETGSFSRAGTKLCVSQSAVSKRIRQLEENLNVSLLDRSGPVLLLTPAGKLVAEKAEVMLSAQDELLDELDVLQQRAPLSFCCTPSFGISFLPKVVSRFMAAYPDITNINFSYNSAENILEGLARGSYQVAVIEHCTPLETSSKFLIPLQGDEMVLIGAPALGLPVEEAPIESILHHAICTSREGCCCRGQLENALAALGKTVADFGKTLVYDDLNLIVKAALDGSGIAYLSRESVVEYLDAGRLVASPVQGFERRFMRSLVVADMYVSAPEVEHLVKIVIETAGTEAKI